MRSILLSLAVLGILAISPLAVAQAPAAKAGAPAGKNSDAIRRMPDGHPDLSGVWQRPFVQDMTKDAPNQKGEPNPPYTEWAKANLVEDFDYSAFCLPLGYTRSINSPMPVEVVQRPDRIVLLYEMNNTFHVIYTDGREHPKDLEPTWFGHSIGTWNRDTLMVDTVGFNEKTRIDTQGHPHTDALHVMETFRMADATHMAYEMTIDDPKAYTKPWKNTRTFTRRPDWELLEYNCNENNKEVNEGHLKYPGK